jgi:methionyl-tRNA formyltransferase
MRGREGRPTDHSARRSEQWDVWRRTSSCEATARFARSDRVSCPRAGNDMKLIFCGTPPFARPTLERLVRDRFRIELVMTNPDEPRGRGYQVRSSPVKEAALNALLAVFQPQKLKSPFTRAFLSQYKPDAIVVVAYGHIIPQWLIDSPRLGCINVHASLLPRYRGAAPIPWAIVRGERVTGVTTMKIDSGLDTGDMLLERETEIKPDDTAETLSARLSLMGADLLVETLRGLERGEIKPRPQDSALATLAPMLKKEDGRIDWSFRAEDIERRVRGFAPWPGAYTTFRAQGFHIWASTLASSSMQTPDAGTLLAVDRRLLVACGSNTWLELLEVQVEGRRRVPARDFLNGIRLGPDERLGQLGGQ